MTPTFARIVAVAVRRPGTWRCGTRRCVSTSTAGAKTSDPLRILFCGSDEFSCASLTALHHENVRNPALVQSVEIMVRPPKRYGRGNKLFTIPPVQKLARELQVKEHVRDTFRGFELPEHINLIVAVSFGLFVPTRILDSAKYGGLNVHPSLLPDLRGPAPIHHALMRGDQYTGVSLQTLDRIAFDHGTILAQTPSPGLAIGPNDTLPELTHSLAAAGAEMLVQGLRDGVHIPPHEDVGWFAKQLEGRELTHAPKVTKRDSQINWTTWTPGDLQRRMRTLGSVWTLAHPCNPRKHLAGPKRIILVDAAPVSPEDVKGTEATLSFENVKTLDGGPQGDPREARVDSENAAVYISLGSGSWVRVRRVKVEGENEKGALVGLKEFLSC